MSSQNPLLILHHARQGQPHRIPPGLDPIWQSLIQPFAQNPAASLTTIIKTLTTAQLEELQFAVLYQYIRLQNVLLTTRHAEILAFLLQNGPATHKTIVKSLAQDPGNTHRRLAALTKKDLIARAYIQDRIHYHLTIDPIR